MKKKKNRFFTFLFSLFPGAGEMYMGFMKMGISLMGMFLLCIAASIGLQVSLLVFPALLIWFYSFFHVHNIMGLNEEQFLTYEDQYLIPALNKEEMPAFIRENQKKWMAFITIFIGISLLWQSLESYILYLIPEQYYGLFAQSFYIVPRIISGVAIIGLGVFMVIEKKQQLDTN
ncbi:MAG: hypothetical protein ACK5ML_08145 [Lachnospiraceae bacterium]